MFNIKIVMTVTVFDSCKNSITSTLYGGYGNFGYRTQYVERILNKIETLQGERVSIIYLENTLSEILDALP